MRTIARTRRGIVCGTFLCVTACALSHQRVPDASARSPDAPAFDSGTPPIDAAPADGGAPMSDVPMSDVPMSDVPVRDASSGDASSVRLDATVDFSTTENPSGPWSYGYVRALGAGLVLFPDPFGTGGVAGWHDSSNAVAGAPAVWRNGSATTMFGVRPGELTLHPGAAGEYTIVRWTAPEAGTYRVDVQFFAGDTGHTDASLLHGGVVVFALGTTTANPAYTTVVTVAVGDTIDIAVGPRPDFYYGNTPATFVLTRE